jgi:arylsulfatase A-like enzyme
MTKQPHIILINPDQWRGDVLGHLDNPAAPTPNLDRLVEGQAVSLANTFCQNPVCTPSRCSFMSGWYPHVRGHRTMYHMMQPDEPVLLRDLKQAGYHVWWGGKNDLVPGQNGFDDYCTVRYPGQHRAGGEQRPIRRDLHGSNEWRGEPGSDTWYSFFKGKIEKPDGFPPEEDFVFDNDWSVVFEAIRTIHNRPADQPLCLFLALSFPHPPYGVEDPWFSAIHRDLLPRRTPTPDGWRGKPSLLKGIHETQGLAGWSEARWDELRATYYGMCARVDHQVGLLVQALQEAGIYDDSAVFLFADHGDFTGDYGLVEKTQNTFEDCLTRVPFIIKPPAGVECQPGPRQALVELVDLRATVEDLAGLEPTYTHFGKSLLPLIAGKTGQHRDAVFCEGGRVHGEEHAMEKQSTSYQSPEGLYYPRLKYQRSEGPEHTKAIMCRTAEYKYVRRLYEQDELYDLRSDPRELVNLVDDPAHAPVLAALKERLLDFLLETGDVVPWQADMR